MEKTSAQSAVESFADMLGRDHKLASEVRASALSRLVWYVAIAGFMIVNAKPYWEVFRGHSLLGYQIFWLSLPWVATALSAIITHILIDVVTIKDNTYYSNKKSFIDFHRIDIEHNELNIDKWKAIMSDTEPQLEKLKNDVTWWFNLAQPLELVTHILLILAFISAITIPFAL